MPSTITTPVSARVPNEQAQAFRAQAARFGLTPSQAIATLIVGALVVEAHGAEPAEARSS